MPLRGMAPALIAAAVAALVYFPSLANDLVWDDRLDILENPRVHDLWHALAYFTELHGIYYRPLVLLTFACDHALWGPHAWGYHLTNLFVHTLNVLLVVGIAVGSGITQRTALLAGLLFGLHPIQTDAVAYVSGRTDLLMTTGALLAWRALQWQQKVAIRGVAAALAVAASVLSKESGFAAVLLVLWWTHGHEREWRARWYLAGPSLLVGIGLLLLRPGHLPLPADGPLPFTGVVAAARVLATYLALLLFPADLQIDRLTASSGTPLAGVVALALALALAAGVVWGLRRAAHADWIVWSVAFYLPASNLLALYPAMADRWLFTPEHNLYAPVAGVAVLVAVATVRLTRKASIAWRWLAAGLACAVVLACAARTIVRLGDWSDEARLFGSAVAAGSSSPRVWYNHGNARGRAGAWSEAADAYRTTLRLAPSDAETWTNLGVALQKQGQLDEAVAAYQHAASLAPPSALLLENLGTAQLRLGDVDGARTAFLRALAIDPDRAIARQALTAIERGPGAGR